jgi:hypothetical protein
MMTASVSIVRMAWDALADLALKFSEFASAIFPVVRIRQRGFALGDARPADLGQLCVEGRHVLLVGRDVFFCINSIDWALRNTNSAVDALIGVNR